MNDRELYHRTILEPRHDFLPTKLLDDQHGWLEANNTWPDGVKKNLFESAFWANQAYHAQREVTKFQDLFHQRETRLLRMICAIEAIAAVVLAGLVVLVAVF